MADPHITFRMHMHQETPYEFDAGYCFLFPLPFISVIFYGKGDRVFVHTDNAVVTDGNPVGIFSKIADHWLPAIKGFFAVKNPFGIVTGIFPVKRALDVHERLVADVEIYFRGFRITMSKQCLDVLTFAPCSRVLTVRYPPVNLLGNRMPRGAALLKPVTGKKIQATFRKDRIAVHPVFGVTDMDLHF